MADGWIMLDNSRYIGETAQVPGGHGPWSYGENAWCKIDANDGALVKRLLKLTNASLVRKSSRLSTAGRFYSY